MIVHYWGKTTRSNAIPLLLPHYKAFPGPRNGTVEGKDHDPGRASPAHTRQSVLLRHDKGDWRVSGLLRQERDAIRPLCHDPS